MHPSANWLKAVFEASWQGSLIIVLILLLRPLLGLRVPARWRSWLWTLALLRLVVPAFLLPPSPASLQNIAAVDRPFEEVALVLDRASAGMPMPLQMRREGPEPEDLPTIATEGVIARPCDRSWWQLAFFVWAAGIAAVVMLMATVSIRLHRRLRRDSTPTDESIERVWLRCCARLSIDHPPRLLATDRVESPALLGLLRPVLLIPKDAPFSEEDWEHIFLHELAHFRRRDHWTQLIQLLAVCAHWFNPLVWVGFRYLQADRELAADEWALQHLDEQRSVAYGETLLRALSAQSRRVLTPGLIGIVEDGAQMKQRLRHILAFTPRRLAGSIAGVGMALALVAVVLGRQIFDLAAYESLAPTESLVIAARRGDRPAVEEMLARGADINGVSNLRGERTALTAAVAANQSEIVRLLVSRGAGVHFHAEKADAPLVVALKKGWRATAEYLRTKGAGCEPELLAAANGDLAAVQAYLATKAPGYDKVKLLAEIAAAHGHREIFATLYDFLKQLPEQREYFPFSRGTFVNAVARGHRGIVEELLARDPNLKPSDSVNRLASAALQNPGMREWLNSQGLNVPEYSDGERLITAAENEDIPEIRRLLAAGVDVHFRGEANWTPLTKASTWGCPRAVKLLLAHGADPNGRRYERYSTLELAKTPEVADLLLAGGAKLTPEDMRYAVTFGTRELVQWFLDHGVDPAKVKENGRPLIFEAASPEIVDLLVARGQDVNARDEGGGTALHWALQMRRPAAPVVAALLKHGADPNARMKGGYTPLMQAQDGLSVDALVAAGADLNATDDRGNNVFYTGWGSGIPSRIEALLRHGMKLDPQKGAELLRNAVLLQRDHAAVKKLLALGVDPAAETTWEGRSTGTVLDAAISNGEFQIAETLRAAGARDVGLLSEAAAKGDLAQMIALLAAGANIDELSANGQTPLHFAVHQGQAPAVKLLLERGANVNLFTATGYTPLGFARLLLGPIEHGNYSPIPRLKPAEAKPLVEEIIAAILARRPDPNFRNATGETALIAGAAIGSVTNLDPGSDVNVQRPDGMTALMIAIATQPRNAPTEGPGSVGLDVVGDKATRWVSGRAHVVETLLKKGADLSLRNASGKTALDLARENGNAEILALLPAR